MTRTQDLKFCVAVTTVAMIDRSWARNGAVINCLLSEYKNMPFEIMYTSFKILMPLQRRSMALRKRIGIGQQSPPLVAMEKLIMAKRMG